MIVLGRRLLPLFALAGLALPAAAAHAAGAADAVSRALAFTVTLEGNGTYGSGVLVDPAAGRIVTNYHVVRDMREPRATFFDGSVARARVVRVDPALDLALLAVAPRPAIGRPSWGSASALRAGDEVFAIGCPRHLAFTVSRGIVSFVDRPLDGVRYLQTDIPINEGNSGGPVIDARGDVVGLMSFIYRNGQGLSFALPADYARRFSAGATAAPTASGAGPASAPAAAPPRSTATSRAPARGRSLDRSRPSAAARSAAGT